jgi:hypothetical protein
MAIRAVCECGKKFEAKDEYEGRRAICPSCKREFVFQRGGIPIFQEVLELPPPLPIRADDDDDQCQPEPNPGPVPTRPFWKDPVVIGGSIIPVTVLSAFFVYLYREHRTKEFHRHVYELKVEADSLAKSGQPFAAMNKYEDVMAAIGDSSTVDGKMRGYRGAAAMARDKIRMAIAAKNAQEEAERKAKADAAVAEAERRAKAESEPLAIEDMPAAAKMFITLLISGAVKESPKVANFKISGVDVERVPDDPRKLSWIWKGTLTVAIAMKPPGPSEVPRKVSVNLISLFRYAPDGRNSGEFWRESVDFLTGKQSRTNFPLCQFTPTFRKKVMERWLSELKEYDDYVKSMEPSEESKVSELAERKIGLIEFFKITPQEFIEILEATD